MSNYSDASKDRLLLSRAYDALQLAEKYHKPQFLPFLNEHECRFLSENISYRQDVSFFGGYDNADRVMMGAFAAPCDFPITPLEFVYRQEDLLRHKDFLGSLLSIGLERSVIGDILTEQGRAVVFVKSEIAPFILSQVTKIGRTGVRIKECDTSSLPLSEDFDLITLTLSSLRLDGFVSAVTHLSREKAQRTIRSELVSIDHIIETGAAKPIKPGDTITIRKYGKYVFLSDMGLSRKGKIRIEVKHYR